MFMTAKTLEGFALHARDGVIGEVQDLYFDDHEWVVRYLVVATGNWLKRDRVLIAPEAVGTPDPVLRILPVHLTTDQVRHSPGIDTAQPVSRQREVELRKHYNWPPYWGAVFADGGIAGPIVPPVPLPPADEDARTDGNRPLRRRGDPNLRSVNDTLRYEIEATDGGIGHLDDLLIDTGGWRIHYLVINTRNWWPGPKVVIAPEWTREVNWEQSRIVVNHSRDAVKASPAYNPDAPWDPEYEARLHEHYRRPARTRVRPAPVVPDDNPNRP